MTADGTHTAPPYRLVNNEYSLLDVDDLVFIDAPGAGFSTFADKEKEKEFYGVDADAAAFADFISQFLRSTAAGTRRSTCSARATGRRARPSWPTCCRARRPSI